MTENMQGRYCPYCGALNSITNRQCSVCGEDLPEVPMDSDDESWHVVPNDDPNDSDQSIIPDRTYRTDSRSKFLVPAILAFCCVLVLSAAGLFIKQL
jgi:hypothetical protein